MFRIPHCEALYSDVCKNTTTNHSSNRLKMGYLSQRKKYERTNILLNSLLAGVGFISILAFLGNSDYFFYSLNTWRLQLYIVAILLFVVSIYYRFYPQAVLAFFLIFINYFVIASASNIFFNVEGDGKNNLSIVYHNATKNIIPLVNTSNKAGADLIGVNHKHPILLPEMLLSYRIFHDDANLDKSFILTGLAPLKAGKLRFNQNREASFVDISKDDSSFIFINIDFSNLKYNEQEVIFHNLADFVLSQDKPVIIIGDFGIPAWSKTFQNFLIKTGLEVKNKIILSDGKSLVNPFIIPSINVLAYKNVGLKNIQFLNKSKNANYPLLIELSI